MSQIGARARRIRESRGETQEAVARRANLPMTTYNRIENGRNEPTLSTLLAIAYALGVSLDDLAGDPTAAA